MRLRQPSLKSPLEVVDTGQKTPALVVNLDEEQPPPQDPGVDLAEDGAGAILP
jgi:hypothetical protein